MFLARESFPADGVEGIVGRVEQFHRTQVADAPPVLFEVLAEQRRRLENLGAAKGDYVSPLDL